MWKNIWAGSTKIFIALGGIVLAILAFMAGRRGLSNEYDADTIDRRNDVKDENGRLDIERDSVLDKEKSHRDDVINHSNKAADISKEGKEQIEKIKDESKDSSIDDSIKRW